MSDVKGYKELALSLDKIVKEIDNPKFLKNAGTFVRDQATLFAPADTGYLQQSINHECETVDGNLVEHIYTDVEYSVFVEMGTGQRGAMNHQGISPNAHPVYRMSPWWIHESQIDPAVPERYGWFHIDTPDGRFYQCNGQSAHPFMYPALHENEDVVADMLDGKLEEIIND